MNKPFELEFYFKGDVIDLKSYDVFPNIPDIGEEYTCNAKMKI
jgi:hypothetical protein